MKHKIKVLLLAGGLSPERDVSLHSAENILKALDRKKYQTILWVVPRSDNPDKFVLSGIKKFAPDIIFIAIHGAYGEDGRVQKLLDKIGVPYTGSGSKASALAMDKIKSAKVFSKQGLLTPRVFSLKTEIKFPLVVKPVDAGSSVGVSVVATQADFRSAIDRASSISKRVIVQEYIRGREVTCGVLEDSKTGRPFALPPTEIVPKNAEFFDYRAKYTPGASKEITPARFPAHVLKEIQKTALTAHNVLGCRGMSRTDMIIKMQNVKIKMQNYQIYVLETNTIPGMTKMSLLPQAARAAGISFSELLDIIIKTSLRG